MLIPLRLPPGAWRNGTEYEARGRWYDLNLVRWRNLSLRPIGGWSAWGDTFTGIARGAYAWTDNSGNRWLAFGTAAKLYVSDDEGTVSDITPSSGFVTGNASATNVSRGYGQSTYGSHPYGTARPDTGAVTLASTWAMDGWGQYLVGCMDGDGDLWEWQLNTGTPAAQIANSPTSCIGLVVTEERFLFALGAGGDPRQIDWCDQEDNTTWTAAATNQAGSFTLETDGEIRCAIKQPRETLILTSTDLWSARYIGEPLVYSFSRVDSGCGAPGNRTAIKINNRAVWLGYGGFFAYDGRVTKLNCDVWDLYLERVSEIQASKIFGWNNVEHQEATWLIPSDTQNECDYYITWNYVEDWWAFSAAESFTRSAGIGVGTFSKPILFGTDSKMYQHEIGYDHGTQTPYAESGPFELGDGDRWVHATRLIPDEQTLAATTVTFKTRHYPTAAETSHGPYTMANPTSVRFSGRQAKLRVSANVEADWRFGVPRLEVTPGGKR